ncbi:uncharacterized protein LOC115880326 [Sitophilus oryzae]|uniref:Uncharacterized protein LOC115880326 n=1 Tax=Sitophilus oryzae TaxID=7048 RepID=A0A6J2XPT6_SITOR|nr:uncharacterized protein LOC115880326 [Sitophilus oryzae]
MVIFTNLLQVFCRYLIFYDETTKYLAFAWYEMSDPMEAGPSGSGRYTPPLPMEEDFVLDENRPPEPEGDPPDSPELLVTKEFDEDDNPLNFLMNCSDTVSPDETQEEDTGMERDETASPLRKKPKYSWNTLYKIYTKFPFEVEPGLQNLRPESGYSALDCFKLFWDDELIDLMVQETNKYARSKFIRPGYHKDFLSGWMDVDVREMKEFISLIIYMSMTKFPDFMAYWSTHPVWETSVACKIMTPTRFQRLITFLHFGTDGSDSYLAKINPVVHRLNENFRKYKIAGRGLYVYMTSIYLRKKYRYIERGTRPKRGCRMLRVLDKDLYTHRIELEHPECETAPLRPSLAKKHVLNSLDGLLDVGRVVNVQGTFVSVDLAKELLRRKTYLAGMIRTKSRGTPKELYQLGADSPLMAGYQSLDGICALNWFQKGKRAKGGNRFYFGLTTYHEPDPITPSNPNPTAAQVVPWFLRYLYSCHQYYLAAEKHSVPSCAAYEEALWHGRVAMELIASVVATNAFVLYNMLNDESISMFRFRDALFRQLADNSGLPYVSSGNEASDPEMVEDESLPD